jgi:putative ATP-binding cassette transporter
MILGTLRNQLIYPSTETQLDDEQLLRVLEQVGLPNLVERFGGLDVQQDWFDVLSLGEQQRVAFARLFINRPRYAILDEATSALDIKNEENLYHHLVGTGTTYISVGHRPTLVKHHHLLLELLENGRWKLS